MAISFSAGSVLEHVELNNMVIAAKGWGVLADPDTTSLNVAELGTPDMSVNVAVGTCFINDAEYLEDPSVNLVIEASHATLYRKDLITYDPSTSHPVVTKGTDHAGGDADPIYPPDIPAGDILLAIVDVDKTVTTITNSDIHDCRIFLPEYNIYSLQSSNTTHKSSTASVDVNTTYWSKAKTFAALSEGIVGGSLRVQARLNKGTTTGIWMQIYRNDYLASSTYHVTGSTVDVTLETFGGWTGGDVCDIYCKADSAGTGYIDNAYIKASVIATRLLRTAPT